MGVAPPNHQNGIQADAPIVPATGLIACKHCGQIIPACCYCCPYCDEPRPSVGREPLLKKVIEIVLAVLGCGLILLLLGIGVLIGYGGMLVVIIGLGFTLTLLVGVSYLAGTIPEQRRGENRILQILVWLLSMFAGLMAVGFASGLMVILLVYAVAEIIR